MPTDSEHERHFGVFTGLAMGASIALGVLTYWATDRGWLLGAPAVLLVCAAVIVTPTSRHLSGRLAVNGMVTLTWIPVATSLPTPIAINGGALLVAASVAVLIATTWRTCLNSASFGETLPRATWCDALPLLAMAVAAVSVRSWLTARTPPKALALLLPGYDYAGHFDNFAMLRLHGRPLGSLGQGPDGTDWYYRAYPEGYHALCAMLAGLFSMPGSSPTDELAQFAIANGVVVVCAAGVLIATICSISALRLKPRLLPGIVCAVLYYLLFGSGAMLITDGFVSFWLASIFVASSLIIAMNERGGWATNSVVVASALVATVFVWLPLVVLGIPSALILLRKREAGSFVPHGADWVWLCAIVVGFAVWQISRSDVPGLITAEGGIDPPSATLSLYLVGLVILVAFLIEKSSKLKSPQKQFGRLIALVPVIGAAVAGAPALFQIWRR